MLTVIVVLACLLRVYTALVRPPAGALGLGGDQRKYDEIGWNLASGRGFSVFRDGHAVATAHVVGPLYALFLGGVYRIAGHQPIVVRFIQCVFMSLLCLVLYELGRVLFDRTVGLVSAGIWAVYPLTIRHTYFGEPAFLLTENLAILLVALSVLMLVRVSARPTALNQLAAGLCLGLSALTRSTFVLFPLAWLLWLVLLGRWPWTQIVRMLLSVIVGMVLVIGPWSWRNYRVFGTLVPLTTLGGKGFWFGNNPLARGGWVGVPVPNAPEPMRTPHDELVNDRLGYRAGWEALIANPWRVPRLLAKKAMVLWLIFHDTQSWRLNWPFVLTAFWALVGWWLVRREPFRWLPVIVPSLFVTMIAMVFLGDPRFRAPLEPLLIVLAAGALTLTVRKWRSALSQTDSRA